MISNRGRKSVKCRCVGCGVSMPTPNALSSSLGLCPECQSKSPCGWRVVYDRERKVGEIPRNLGAPH
jgi:hypothetical protein